MNIVLCNGVWDVWHHGHLTHLQQAKAMGDYLIVSVTKDYFVNKVSGRPVFSEYQRADMLRELRCVDEVITVVGVIDALQRSKAKIFVKGNDYTIDTIEPAHREYCASHGIQIRFTTGEKFSSTALIERLLE